MESVVAQPPAETNKPVQGKYLRRFLVPQFVVTIHYWLKYRCFVSPRSDVELSPRLTIGRKTRISSYTKINATAGPVTIGERVGVGVGSCISAGEGGVVIGDDCMISPRVTVLAGGHRYDRIDIPMNQQGMTSKGIRIGNDVWLGTGCVVLDGAVIEDGCIVSPNSVVSSRLPQNSIAQGNPAKVVFTRR